MYYGFDMGGTKIEFGAFDQDLNRIATERIPTPKTNYLDLLNALKSLVEKYDQQFNIKGKVGIGIPGIESYQDGSLLTTNIEAGKGQFLRKDLEKLINRPVTISNDANCFALSEAWDDEHQGKETVLGLILGTGFGGGIVSNGSVIQGESNCAGEVGHFRVPIDAWQYLEQNYPSKQPPMFDCGCGKKGCIDNYLSGRGFEQLYHYYYHENLAAIDIIKNFENKEEKAVEFVTHFIELLAICLGNLFTIFDPDAVVLGGGLSNFDHIYQALPERLPQYLLSVAKVPDITKAKYGDSGGVRGAAFLNL